MGITERASSNPTTQECLRHSECSSHDNYTWIFEDKRSSPTSQKCTSAGPGTFDAGVCIRGFNEGTRREHDR